MGNPYEFREIMKATFGYSDKTVEQVEAEIAQRERDREFADRNQKGRTGTRQAAAPAAKPKQSEVNRLAEIMERARQIQAESADKPSGQD